MKTIIKILVATILILFALIALNFTLNFLGIGVTP